jgi:hypothetical protein
MKAPSQLLSREHGSHRPTTARRPLRGGVAGLNREAASATVEAGMSGSADRVDGSGAMARASPIGSAPCDVDYRVWRRYSNGTRF